MSPRRVPHSLAIELIDRYVRRAFPRGHRIRIQLPFLTVDGSEPEPDIAVIQGNLSDVISEHPSTAALLVEISDTTIRHDRRKARLYSQSGIADFWIVNLVARTLEVYRDPLPGGGPETGPTYASVRTFGPTDHISPLAAPDARTKVAELLP